MTDVWQHCRIMGWMLGSASRLWSDMKAWMKKPGMKIDHFHHYIRLYLFCISEDDPERLLHKFMREVAALYSPRRNKQ